MAGLEGISIVDTMIGFAAPSGVDREIPQVKAAHRGFAHTADYMFTDVPDDDPDDPITATLTEMDRHGVGVGLVNTGRPEAIEAARRHPNRFVLETHVGQMGRPVDIVGEVRRIRAEHAEFGTRAVSFFVVSGNTEQEFEAAMAATKQQIAFYGSTPAYAKVFECHGWEDLQPRLNTLSKQGDWVGMGDLINDEVLDAFAVVGEPHEIAPGLKARYGDVVDRISFYAPGQGQSTAYCSVMN